MRFFTKMGSKARTENDKKAIWLINNRWQEVTEDEWNLTPIPSSGETAEEILDIILGEEVGE